MLFVIVIAARVQRLTSSALVMPGFLCCQVMKLLAVGLLLLMNLDEVLALIFFSRDPSTKDLLFLYIFEG